MASSIMALGSSKMMAGAVIDLLVVLLLLGLRRSILVGDLCLAQMLLRSRPRVRYYPRLSRNTRCGGLSLLKFKSSFYD
jgi:hypothetical protein